MKEKTCNKCYGYGWWSLGGLSPLGKMDASEWKGNRTKCPWCNAGELKNDRYKALKKIKESEKK